MLMVVRQENNKINRYCHIGTGNYHVSNTAVYTDYGYMTSNKDITEDVHKLFMQLTTYGENQELKKLVQSPYGIRDMVIENINKEIQHAEQGHPAKIIAKMNGLVSPIIIESLYKASQAGVQIDLIIRGICCLKPQVKGLSENIRVHSILGRFLEHGRIYWFHNNGEDQVFCSSADWMPRNLIQRIEASVEITQKSLKKRLMSDLELHLSDNQHRWELNSDGTYTRQTTREGEDKVNSQQLFLKQLSLTQ